MEKDTSQSEPILLNAEFLNNLNDDEMFWDLEKATNDVYPNTDIYTMPLNKKTLKFFINGF